MYVSRAFAALCGGGLFIFGGVAPAGAQSAVPSFRNVSVHDPSVIRAAGSYYVFGSHLASARTTDLMGWTQLSTSPAADNPVFPNSSTLFSEAIAWAGGSNFWAPDVHQLPDGRFYFYYCTCAGDSPRSALGLAVADSVTGPYTNLGVFLKSGMWGQTSPDGTIYDATRHPNTVDPCVFADASGRKWMVYGSYSGGIFILQLSPSTGLPLAGQGYGKKLIGGNHSRIEAPYILYHPGTGYYYLFLSFGGLSSDGGYQVRVGRSSNPDGPYLDAAGNNLTNVAGPAGSFFDDAAIAPYGAKLIGNYQFLHVDGEPRSTSRGYLSPGHNSAIYDAATGRAFMIFHTRFVGRGEEHEVRVHQVYFNDQGWPVVAPHRYAGESPATFTTGQIPGRFKLINHGKDISSGVPATVHESGLVTLAADASVSGAATGTWALSGDRFLTLTLAGVTYRGVVSRQWDDDNQVWVLAFSALSSGGVSVWGSKVAAPNVAPTLANPGARTVAHGDTLRFSLVASDPDFGQTLSYSLVAGPFGASLDAATGEFAWTPLLAQVGETHSVTVRVTDNGADPRQTDTTFSIAVTSPTMVRRLALDFNAAGSAGLRDAAGVFTGFTARLPGTGSSVPAYDPLLSLSTASGVLARTTTQADYNGSAGLAANRSVGLALSSLGFTGTQDFAVTAVFRPLPTLGFVDQVGLFVGANATTLTRAGAILFGSSPERYAVHTQGGSDVAAHFGGTSLVVSDGMTVTIQREGGVWRYLVDGVEWNPLVNGVKNDPAFLGGFADLTAGVFAITPFNTNAKTVQVESFTALVDSGQPPPTLLQTWRQSRFGVAEPTGNAADEADPDADGLANLLEYALGSEPLSVGSGVRPSVSATTLVDGPHLTLAFTRIADPALTYAVEAATAAGGPYATVWSSSGEANAAGPVTVTDPVAAGSGGVTARFLRLRVTR